MIPVAQCTGRPAPPGYKPHKEDFGESAGHPFRGNQWKSGEAEDKSNDLKSVSSAHPTTLPSTNRRPDGTAEGTMDSAHAATEMHKAEQFINAGLPVDPRFIREDAPQDAASMLKAAVAADISARMSDIPASDVARASGDGHVQRCAEMLGRTDVMMYIDNQGRLGLTMRDPKEGPGFDPAFIDPRFQAGGSATDKEWQQSVIDREQRTVDSLTSHYSRDLRNYIGADDPRCAGIVHEAATSAMVQSWAMSSNDTSGRALGIQERASAIFGVEKYSTWEDQTTPSLSRETDDYVRENGATVDAFLTAQYEATQAAFKEAGITELQLYRGETVESPAPLTRDAVARLGGQDGQRPLSAWSSSPGQASRFAEMRSHDSSIRDLQVTHAATVPVERILSTPRTGFGCYAESEFVVIGGPGEVHTTTHGNR